MQKSKVFTETKNIANCSSVKKYVVAKTNQRCLWPRQFAFFFLLVGNFFLSFLYLNFLLLLNNMMTFFSFVCSFLLLMIKELDPALGPQFQILRKLSQDPVHTAMPSSVTPRQLTRLSWPARTPRNTTKQSLIILIHLLHLSTKTKKMKKYICMLSNISQNMLWGYVFKN